MRRAEGQYRNGLTRFLNFTLSSGLLHKASIAFLSISLPSFPPLMPFDFCADDLEHCIYYSTTFDDKLDLGRDATGNTRPKLNVVHFAEGGCRPTSQRSKTASYPLPLSIALGLSMSIDCLHKANHVLIANSRPAFRPCRPMCPGVQFAILIMLSSSFLSVFFW